MFFYSDSDTESKDHMTKSTAVFEKQFSEGDPRYIQS